jgi:hypothetical protein
MGEVSIMKGLIFYIVLLSFCLGAAVGEAAWQKTDIVEYHGYTGEDIEVAWDQVVNLTYDLALFNKERDIQLPLANDFTGVTLTFQVPKTGHWIVKVRARRGAETSEWSESIDPTRATVDGEARGWMLFTWIAPAGPIEF